MARIVSTFEKAVLIKYKRGEVILFSSESRSTIFGKENTRNEPKKK